MAAEAISSFKILLCFQSGDLQLVLPESLF